MKLAVLPLLAVLLSACPPAPPPNPPPQPDADAAPTPEAGPPPAGACADACAALDRVGCGLGGGTCVAFMQTLSDSRQLANPATHKPLTCAEVASVKSRADAVKLGFACLP